MVDLLKFIISNNNKKILNGVITLVHYQVCYQILPKV